MNKQYLTKFNDYFHNIFINREVTSTETLNFLNLYTDYLMHIYGLDYDNYTIKIHAIKTNQDAISSKKDRFEKKVKCRTVALLSPDNNHENTYDIYLNSDYMKMKDYFDLPDILYVIINCGHEIRHIIQYELHGEKALQSLVVEKDIENSFEKSILTKNKKLQKCMRRYYTDFRNLSLMERDSDKIAFITLLDVLYILKENEKDKENCNENYIYFLSLCEDYVRFFKRKRNNDYTKLFKDYYKVKQELAEFNIETSLP